MAPAVTGYSHRMKPPQPNETELEDSQRIRWLIDAHLVRVTTDASGWRVLYRDPSDDRLWELSYPRSEMHGGGPPKLTCIPRQQAEAVYKELTK